MDGEQIMSKIKIQEGYRYYQSKLSGACVKVYEDLLEGMLSFSEKIRVGGCTFSDINLVFQYVLYDTPAIFYVDAVSMVTSTGLVIDVYPDYRFKQSTVIQLSKELSFKAERLREKTFGQSEYDRIKAIHDYLITDLDYQTADTYQAHTILGPLYHASSVCSGIGKAFKYLADHLGIASFYLTGESLLEDGTLNGRHGWNVVMISNRFYHLDATFDLNMSTPNIIHYDYFLLSDSQISVDHSFSCDIDCPQGIQFYPLVQTRRDVKRLISDQLKPGAEPVVVQLEGLSSETIGDLVMSMLPPWFCYTTELKMKYNPSRNIMQFTLKRI